MATLAEKSKPSFVDRVLQLYSEGANDSEIAAELNFSMQRFNELYEENPGFQRVVDIGRTKSDAWWNAVARRNLVTKGFQGSTWAFVMKNRFGWRDRIENTEITTADATSTDELKKELATTLKRIETLSPAAARKIMETGDEDGRGDAA